MPWRPLLFSCALCLSSRLGRQVGNDADKWLEKMGGERVFEVGNGDDDGTLEEDFETWKVTSPPD